MTQIKDTDYTDKKLAKIKRLKKRLKDKQDKDKFNQAFLGKL